MVKTLYLEDVGPEGGVGQLEDVVGSDQVEPRLVLVHRVDNGLGRAKWVKTWYLVLGTWYLCIELTMVWGGQSGLKENIGRQQAGKQQNRAQSW